MTKLRLLTHALHSHHEIYYPLSTIHFLLLTLLFAGCGIDEYFYLTPVSRDNNITVTSNDRAVIRLPSGEPSYFSSFVIYYRMYVSDILDSAPSADTSSSKLSSINPTLSQDYYTINPYISSDTLVNTNISALFSSRKFYTIEVEGANIRDILGSASQGQTIILDFIQQKIPTFQILETGQTLNLLRSTDNGRFSPRPLNRYFINDSELYAPANINETTNADVADKTGISGTKYTYILLYIVVTGLDTNLSPLYSTPAFIGILKLPEGNS